MGVGGGVGREDQTSTSSSISKSDLLAPLHPASPREVRPNHGPDSDSSASRRTNFGAVALTCSLLVNMLCLILWTRQPSSFSSAGSGSRDESEGINVEQWTDWSKQAALDTESAAAFQCAGHGAVFVDTLARDANGLPICECNQCFTGPDCSESVLNCYADVISGDPIMLEEFWKQNLEDSTVVIPGWYRMSYWPSDSSMSEPGLAYNLDALEHEIRALHDLVGNAVTKDRYIVLGTGSIQLINAAVTSISDLQRAVFLDPVKVVAASPSLVSYGAQTNGVGSRSPGFQWAGDATQYAQVQVGEDGYFIELVASPNNPDGKLQNAFLNGNATTAIYDLAYYWPHFGPITSAAAYDIMVFTLSTVTGHAGSRIGWAVVKDKALAEGMASYVWTTTLGVSHESQLRSSVLLKAVVAGYRKTLPSQLPLHNQTMEASFVKHYASSQHLFHYAHAVLRDRWERLQNILSNSSRITLQELEPQICSFFDSWFPPSPGYAWVRCNDDSEPDCEAFLKRGGILGRGGADPRFVRLSLLKREAVFGNLVNRLASLVSV